MEETDAFNLLEKNRLKCVDKKLPPPPQPSQNNEFQILSWFITLISHIKNRDIINVAILWHGWFFFNSP